MINFNSEKLKKMWNENPIGVIVIGAMAAQAAAKLINAVSAAQSRRAYANMVKYRMGGRR